tara:strand:- start:634 stop:828 length:195 start_codon:yes stop_codon:yes gene_type:complete
MENSRTLGQIIPALAADNIQAMKNATVVMVKEARNIDLVSLPIMDVSVLRSFPSYVTSSFRNNR